jgi:L-ribulose-5-phosphate 4-epimerase
VNDDTALNDHEMAVAVARARATVARLHADLVRYQLVAWTAGNVSERVPGTDLFVIKPSGVSYDDLTPESMVVCDLTGKAAAGSLWPRLAPSSDTAAHAYVYRHMPQVGGVVHTHSTYATAWAARGEPVPCALTAIADEFGGEIPVGPFAPIGDDAIGRGIVETLSGHRSRAVLMRNHGVFTIGKDGRDAVKPPSWPRTPPAPCTSPTRPDRSRRCLKTPSARCSTGTRTSTDSPQEKERPADARIDVP